MSKKCPPLRIHIWGGLGSQLFAIALAFDILKMYPKRELILVLHSSGVTKRQPEVCGLFPEFKYHEVDDFSARESHDSRIRYLSFRSIFLAFLRNCALFSGVLAEENDGRTRRVHKWTLSVRGHYSHRVIDKEFLKILGLRLHGFLKNDNDIYREKVILHYRLGDLVELTNKTNINPHRIANIFSRIGAPLEITVLSDSPEMARALIEETSPKSTIVTDNLSTVKAIWAGAGAKTFIGTSSKISYWIILLRTAFHKQSQNFMPTEDEKILRTISLEDTNVQLY
jgi:hypothetical protein